MALTDEDKVWFTQQLEGLEANVKAYVDTKLERLAASFDTKLEGLEANVKAYIDAKLELLETKLLTEFHKWASPLEMRQRTHAAAIRALDIETEALADKVKNLEERPGAA